MSPLRAYRTALALLLGASLTSCTFNRLGPGPSERRDNYVSEREVSLSGAKNAWEVIRRTLPHLQLREDRNGSPARMHRRGRSSILLDDRPSVFLDGVRIMDLQRLAHVPAMDIYEIRFLNGMDGTTRYGTNSGEGVILIVTKTGRS